MTLTELIKQANALRRKYGDDGGNFEVVLSDPDNGAEQDCETMFASPSRKKIMVVAGGSAQLTLEPSVEQMRDIKIKEPAK